MGVIFNEHGLNRVTITDIPKALPALDAAPQEFEPGSTAVTHDPSQDA